MSEKLFPLPLTLWEELFVIDDYENYPANFMTRVRCQGKVPRELFLTALRNCVTSHPLFGCRVSRRGRRYFWEQMDSKELPAEFFESQDAANLPTMSKFDVFENVLWRVWVVHWQDESASGEGEKCHSDIFVEFHHSLCDGLGAIQFISDVAKEIHDLYRLAGDDREESPTENTKVAKLRHDETDLDALRDRGRFKRTWKEFFRDLPYYYKSFLASLRLIITRVDSLVPIESVPKLMNKAKTSLGYQKIVFTVSESSKLRRVCRKQDTTVNSKVAAELFLTVDEWKQEKGHQPSKALRVMIPFNERGISDARLPACNRVSISPFTRSRSEFSDGDRLLASIELGVKLIKKRKLGLNFHRGLWFCKYILGSLKILAKTNRVGTTGVFANVGNLQAHLGLPANRGGMECGPFTIVDIDLIPTIRIGTSFAMTMHEFNGETRLGIHFDSAVVSAEEAESFAEHLRRRILKIVE